jgi:hypothetical protein
LEDYLMGDVAEHSLLSASAAPRWTRCYGSVALESTQPNEGSKYTREGTAAHALASWLLGGSPKELAHWDQAQNMGQASDFIGMDIVVEGDYFTVDVEMADAVQSYVDYCRSLGGVALVETKVSYANWLGVADDLAWGTSDFIAIHDDPEVITIDAQGYRDAIGEIEGRLIMTDVDYKHGAGVAVYPEHNEQAMFYAGGSLNEIEFAIDVRDDDIVRIVIHQPRIGEGEPLEWYIQVGALKRWLRGEAATAAAHAVKLWEPFPLRKDHGPEAETLEALMVRTGVANDLTPGDKQCKFCNAKAICPALSKLVVDTVTSGFTDLTQVTVADIKAAEYTPLELSEKLKLAPLIEAALKSWRAAGEALLIEDPESVPDWKLVRGKKGDRKWIDAVAVSKRLVRYVGTAMAYKPREPISPTKAEELLKAKKISAKQWAELQKLYDQAEGGVSMAPASDPRPALDLRPSPAAFPDLTGDEDDLSHLA